jgi:hypothetical protein
MTTYTEEIQTNVTILNDGTKEIRTVTVTLKDGVEVGRTNHRSVVAADEDVPADIESFIEAKKVKQPNKAD